jgi:hypothetical protein
LEDLYDDHENDMDMNRACWSIRDKLQPQRICVIMNRNGINRSMMNNAQNYGIKLQLLQNPSHKNGDNLNNIKCKPVEPSGTKRGNMSKKN